MKIRQPFPRLVGPPVWRESDHICAIADGDRHLGHGVQDEDGVWHAYDATKLNPNRDGFKYIGQFSTAAEAKEAVKNASAQPLPLVFKANGGAANPFHHLN
jgi:hypothetical protein